MDLIFPQDFRETDDCCLGCKTFSDIDWKDTEKSFCFIVEKSAVLIV